MKKSIKWIILSFHNALFLYLFFLPEINFYAIARLTEWSSNFVFTFTKIVPILIVVIMTVTLYRLAKRFFYEQRSAYWLTVSWIPCYYILIKLSAFIMPIAQPGDDAAPVTGLLIIASFFFFPIYIFLVTIFAISSQEKKTSYK